MEAVVAASKGERGGEAAPKQPRRGGEADMSTMNSINPAGTPADVLVLRRLIDAPRDLVFAVWSDPLQVAEWWRPAGYSTPVFEMDFRVGGGSATASATPVATAGRVASIARSCRRPTSPSLFSGKAATRRTTSRHSSPSPSKPRTSAPCLPFVRSPFPRASRGAAMASVGTRCSNPSSRSSSSKGTLHDHAHPHRLSLGPAGRSGLVRDLRVRWVLEEAGRPYQVRLIGPEDQKSAAYRALQPFGQVPAHRRGRARLFESGAIVLYVAEGSPMLLPTEAAARLRARRGCSRL